MCWFFKHILNKFTVINIFFHTQQLFCFFLLFHHENVKLNFIISHVHWITNVWRHECELNNQHVNFIHSRVISLFSRGLQNTFHFFFFYALSGCLNMRETLFSFHERIKYIHIFAWMYLQLKIINTNVCRWFSRVIGCVHTLWTNIITCEKNIFTLFFTYDDYFVTCRSEFPQTDFLAFSHVNKNFKVKRKSCLVWFSFCCVRST